MPSERKSYRDDDAKDAKDEESKDEKVHHPSERKANDDENVLVSKVISFFFENEDFSRTFENFAEKYAYLFDPDEEEMKLE